MTMASSTTHSLPSAPLALMVQVLLLIFAATCTKVSAFVPLRLGRLDHVVAFQRQIGISLAAEAMTEPSTTRPSTTVEGSMDDAMQADSSEIPIRTFSAPDVGPSPLSMPRPAAAASSPKTTPTLASDANAKTNSSGSVPVCGGSNMSSLGAFREQHIPLTKDMVDPKNTPDAARYRKNTNFFQLYQQGRASSSSQ